VQAKVLVAAATADRTRIRAVEDCGAEVLLLPNPRGKVDLPALLQELARRGINEIHAEAGFKLNGSLLREDCVDELLVYLAPCLVGEGQGMFDLAALASLEHRRRLRVRELRAVGEDYRLLARFADVETQVVGLQPPQRADDPAAA
jgi:diaminohydroxyphosphoribosylaminopyrimidine deaminase/5-amino-6-(5-phosphoribosylamino)uracil reductase